MKCDGQVAYLTTIGTFTKEDVKALSAGAQPPQPLHGRKRGAGQ